MEQKQKCRSWWRWVLGFIVLAIIIGAVLLTYTNKLFTLNDEVPVPGAPGQIDKQYSDALKIAIQFFDVQKSGKLEDNTISWRGDSGLDDGKDASLDLSKGMYDAGDHIKFGFPMAFTATMLSWTILEYGDQLEAVGHLKPATNSLKWITDYLINAHPEEKVLYVQVGDVVEDHKCWDRPETMTSKRTLLQINSSSPGSDVAAETAAAMASASLVFKKSNSTYSSTLLKHAQQLFTFADENREYYSVSIPEVKTYYNSTGYGDELLWAASWLYHATGDNKYLEFVSGQSGDDFAEWGKLSWFSWDNKLAGTQVLLSRLSFFDGKGSGNSVKNYRKTAEELICGLIPDSPTATDSRTKNGLIWIGEWNSLQHPVAAAFLATVFSNYMLTSQTETIHCKTESYKASDIRKFAISQADYILGVNPLKMSFLVGYGKQYPKQVHHRGASIPADAQTGCSDGFKWLKSKDKNPNVAMGAVVGGPFLNETYKDIRNNSMQGEPTTYNSALIVGLLSGLVTTSSVVKSFR